jgi:hypothetical protein
MTGRGAEPSNGFAAFPSWALSLWAPRRAASLSTPKVRYSGCLEVGVLGSSAIDDGRNLLQPKGDAVDLDRISIQPAACLRLKNDDT